MSTLCRCALALLLIFLATPVCTMMTEIEDGMYCTAGDTCSAKKASVRSLLQVTESKKGLLGKELQTPDPCDVCYTEAVECEKPCTDHDLPCLKNCEDTFIKCEEAAACDPTVPHSSKSASLIEDKRMLSGQPGAIDTETYEIPSGPVGGTPIAHPGRVVKIGYRCGAKSCKYIEGQDHMFGTLFGDSSKYKYSKVTDLNPTDMAEYDCFFDFIPEVPFTSSDIATMKDFILKGGRLITIGEHSGFAAAENIIISDLVAALGGGIAVKEGSLSGASNVQSADAKGLNDVPAMSGIKSIHFAAWAPLAVVASVTDILAADAGGSTNKIAIADQKLGKGRVTIWADINPVAVASTGSKLLSQNKVFVYNLVHQAAQMVDLVENGGNPNECENGQCEIWGDPHITAFDKSKVSLLSAKTSAWQSVASGTGNFATGDFWLVKSDPVSIQGRFTKVSHNKNTYLTALAIGGKFIEDNKMVVEGRNGRVLWNGNEILQSSKKGDHQSRFEVKGLLSAINHHQKRVSEPGVSALGVDLRLAMGVNMTINRWHEKLSARISMPKLAGGQDGQCGNFNGDSTDDTMELIQQRVGDIPKDELLFPQ